MKSRNVWGLIVAGLCAGAINGLLGAGGGMVLVPLLLYLAHLPEDQVFPTSVAVILPVSVVSLIFSISRTPVPAQVLPYLMGSALGGILAGTWGRKIPTVWLHRILGAFIIVGGIRYLW